MILWSRSLIRQGNDLDRKIGVDLQDPEVLVVSIPYSSGQ